MVSEEWCGPAASACFHCNKHNQSHKVRWPLSLPWGTPGCFLEKAICFGVIKTAHVVKKITSQAQVGSCWVLMPVVQFKITALFSRFFNTIKKFSLDLDESSSPWAWVESGSRFLICSFLRDAEHLLWQLKLVGAVCAQHFGRKTACACVVSCGVQKPGSPGVCSI